MTKLVALLLSQYMLLIPLANASVEIELITMGPGENYWEAFGHSAIRVKSDDQDIMYGFGYFDFEDKDFFINFAKGEMRYFLGVEYSENEFNDYVSQGRYIWSQKLNLTDVQKQNLLSKLDFLSQPENQFYHYDYFLSNCTTKIRDLLDEVSNGELSSQLTLLSTNKSWNDLTFPVDNQAWMNLGIAMAYGLPAYKVRNRWDLNVFPKEFALDLQDVKTKDNWVSRYSLFYKPSAQEQSHYRYNFFKTHYAILLIVGLLLVGIIVPFTRKGVVVAWLLTQSVIGVLLLLLWFFTKHTVAAVNINVLLFSPFAFLLSIKSLQKPFLLVFLLVNITWLLLAAFFTNYYLIGFSLINLIIWYQIKHTTTNIN